MYCNVSESGSWPCVEGVRYSVPCQRQSSQHANQGKTTPKILRAFSLREAFCLLVVGGHRPRPLLASSGRRLGLRRHAPARGLGRRKASLKASAHSEPQAPWPPSLVRTTYLWEGVEMCGVVSGRFRKLTGCPAPGVGVSYASPAVTSLAAQRPELQQFPAPS